MCTYDYQNARKNHNIIIFLEHFLKSRYLERIMIEKTTFTEKLIAV
jgi:hypothetical protein